VETPNWLERPLPAGILASPNRQPLVDIEGRALAQAIVDTIREPLLVLDKDLRVVTANRAFYLTFRMNRQVDAANTMAVSVR
jgi:PAS domain-containing protein